MWQLCVAMMSWVQWWDLKVQSLRVGHFFKHDGRKGALSNTCSQLQAILWNCKISMKIISLSDSKPQVLAIDDILFSNNTNKGSIIKDQELRKSELYKSKKVAFHLPNSFCAWEIDLNIWILKVGFRYFQIFWDFLFYPKDSFRFEGRFECFTLNQLKIWKKK